MIYFRADANENIGLGHVMRCLALADGFRALGKECLFILASDTKNDAIITQRGYSFVRLTNGYLEMAKEAEELQKILSDPEAIFIVDSYFVPDGYEECVKRIIAGRGRYICFDDEMNKAFAADGLINYNLYADAKRYEQIYSAHNLPLPKLYLGGDYIPLRTDIEDLPDELRIKAREDGRLNVLLSCGGADPEKVTVRFLRFLKEEGNFPGAEKFVFHIPVGAVNAAKEQIYDLAENMPCVKLYGHISPFRAFIRQMDLAVSAAGSTLYELCMEGIPTVTYVLADNQKELAGEFERLGLMPFAGDCRNNEAFVRDLLNLLRKLSERNDLDDLRKKMRKTVDGLGAKRLAEEILKDNRG